MARIFYLMRCVGKAAVKNGDKLLYGGKRLFGEMPGGKAVYDIAKDVLVSRQSSIDG